MRDSARDRASVPACWPGSSAYDERGRRTSAECARSRQERDRDGHVGVAGADRLAVDRAATRRRDLQPLSQRESRCAAARQRHRARVAVAIDRRVGADAVAVDGRRRPGPDVHQSRRVGGLSPGHTPAAISDVSHHGTQTLAGGHVHARWSPHRGITLAGGVRGDRVVDLETFVGGWAQAQVALSSDFVLTAAVGRHGQSPDVLQRFGPAGTADLAFETATLVDAGLAWRRGPWGLAINLYDRHEADGLDTPERQFRLTPEGDLAGGNPRAPWENAWTGRARGAEVLLRRQSAPGRGSPLVGMDRLRLRHHDIRERARSGVSRRVRSAPSR